MNHVVKSRATYQKVFDDRKRRIRGLWKRNGFFYARLVILDETTGHKTTKRVRLDNGGKKNKGLFPRSMRPAMMFESGTAQIGISGGAPRQFPPLHKSFSTAKYAKYANAE